MNILITGGTGFLGRHAARLLLHSGHRVRLMGRDFAEVADLLAAGAEPVRADLRDHPAVIAACAGADAVVHAGALSAPWGPRRDFLAVNLGGTAAVLAGCRRHGVARLVAISSPAVVFTGRDHVLTTEDAPYPRQPSSIYAHSKRLAEELLRAAPDVPAVTLRPKAIFGPGDRALLPRIIAAARAGRLPQVGHGRNLVDLTYVENVAHAIALALTAEAAVGRTYHITNGEHVPLWALIRDVLARLGIPARLPRVPLPAMLAAATAMEARAAISGREPLLTRYSVAILARTQTYDIAAARRDLGYAPVISVAEGVERTMQMLNAEC
ncbi:NAD-dependent epimerase/dehydratase family protein [Oscillochloris sp. ZM17-4]|uniref:NAD-dependent epimerase/dehydratase family protein n=1 Tax=Oscillochloris sp. ZM17-4 TaxID=2866714 RepID=UPI001C737DBB|nr:NAD-dependent epimerase/dehydratase family protein [Oscillochloris sp. ZM17-4]MBX0327211.1 NAD-dependent epimerase/dehydratase family protein [Oscillochloris sp. ZM17-4]